MCWKTGSTFYSTCTYRTSDSITGGNAVTVEIDVEGAPLVAVIAIGKLAIVHLRMMMNNHVLYSRHSKNW